MAAIAISDAELAGNLKNVYSDITNNLFPIVTPTFAQIKKRKAGLKWGGNGVYFNVLTGRPVGATFSDSGSLGVSSKVNEKQGFEGVARLYVTRQFDNLAMVGTASKESAFASLNSRIVDEFEGAMKLGMEQHLNGNGTGVCGIVASSADTTHCVVTSPWGLASSGQGGLFLDVGQTIAVLDSSGVSRGVSKITSITNSGDNASLVLATAVSGLTGTDLIVPADVNGGNAWNQACNGLQNLLNFGGNYASVHDISAATFPRTDTTRLVAGTDVGSASDPNEMDVWELAMRVGQRSGQSALTSPKEFFAQTTFGITKKLIQSAAARTTVTVANGSKITIDGGYEADQVLGIPLISSSTSPAGYVMLVHKPSIAYFSAADWSKVQYEGSGDVRWVSGKDHFETSYKTYFNVLTDRRNAHGLISGYTDTSRYSYVV